MQGPLSSDGQSAASHLSGYLDVVGVGPFAIQLTVVYGHSNLSLPYVLIKIVVGIVHYWKPVWEIKFWVDCLDR